MGDFWIVPLVNSVSDMWLSRPACFDSAFILETEFLEVW